VFIHLLEPHLQESLLESCQGKQEAAETVLITNKDKRAILTRDTRNNKFRFGEFILM
jgi:hypothetical protein